MDKENKNIPQIRFPGFEGEWEWYKLDDIADYKKGPFGSALKKDLFVPKGNTTIKVYEQQNAIKKDWTLERYFITKEYAKNLMGFSVTSGDIIVSCAGTIGEIYEIPNEAEPGIINQALMRIKVKELIVDRKMFIILFANMIDDFTKVHSNGSAIKNIPPLSDLKSINILVPQIEEQQKISTYFSNLDNLIILSEQELNGYKELKKCMLQKMFPKEGESVPEIRFPGFEGDWECRRLGDMADIIGGGTPSTKNPTYWNGDINWYAPAEITNQIYVSSSQKKITQEGFNHCSTKMLPIGTILFTSRAGIGKTAILAKEGCTNQGFQSIVPYKDKLDSYFIFSRTEELKCYGEAVGAGSTFIEVSGKQMANMRLMMPKTLEEQQKIGLYFKQLDNLISISEQELNEYKRLKKCMLQKMFC
jgi:type I restriction enzyme S subunit